MKNKFWIEMDGIEPVFCRYKTDGRNTSTTRFYMFYPIRRIIKKRDDKKLNNYLLLQGYKPVKCQGCGEGWSEYIIEDPNKPFGTKVKIKVCKHCVGFYDWKWTRKKLYKDVEDFRG